MQKEKDLVLLEHFMASTRPVTGAAGFQVSSSLERPLWWAMERLGLAGDGRVSSYEQRWKSAQGSYVHLGIVKVSCPPLIIFTAFDRVPRRPLN